MPDREDIFQSLMRLSENPMLEKSVNELHPPQATGYQHYNTPIRSAPRGGELDPPSIKYSVFLYITNSKDFETFVIVPIGA